MDTLISNNTSTYTLSSHLPVPPLSSHISDFHLSLLLPIAAYWLSSLFWGIISYYGIWAAHRIHTPAELQIRNRASVPDVLYSLIGQQSMQTAWGLFLGYVVFGTEDFIGPEDYEVAVWAARVGNGLSWIEWGSKLGMAILGLDLTRSKGSLHLPFHVNITTPNGQPIAWEVAIAQVIYRVLAPAVRLGLAVLFNDAWQYFGHRAFHENKWMYRHIHALHHKVNAPYAFGAYYNTLTESFIMDTIGATLSFYLTGLTRREVMFFSTMSVLKGVDDHCGYKLRWDPFQWLGEQDTAFHDIHHQTWGAGTNYSQVYTTLWDHVLGTVSRKSQAEIDELYKKGRETAERAKKVE